MTIVYVRRVRDAHGAECRDCDLVWKRDPFLRWRRYSLMHERGMGYTMRLFRVS